MKAREMGMRKGIERRGGVKREERDRGRGMKIKDEQETGGEENQGKNQKA